MIIQNWNPYIPVGFIIHNLFWIPTIINKLFTIFYIVIDIQRISPMKKKYGEIYIYE